MGLRFAITTGRSQIGVRSGNRTLYMTFLENTVYKTCKPLHNLYVLANLSIWQLYTVINLSIHYI